MLHNNLWKTLRLIAIFTLVLIFQIAVDTYTQNQEIIWVKDKLLELVWEPPQGGSDHYRIEILKTDLFAVPVTSSLSYKYTKSNRLEIELLANHSYTFRVQSVTSFGALSDYSDYTPFYIFKEKKDQIQERSKSDTPLEFSLFQNYPNPFNNSTTIKYQIPHSGMEGNKVRVRLEIYNILGQRIKELLNKNQLPGEYSITWDGKDDNGRQVTSGLYLYQLIAGDRKVLKKMIYLK